MIIGRGYMNEARTLMGAAKPIWRDSADEGIDKKTNYAMFYRAMAFAKNLKKAFAYKRDVFGFNNNQVTLDVFIPIEDSEYEKGVLDGIAIRVLYYRGSKSSGLEFISVLTWRASKKGEYESFFQIDEDGGFNEAVDFYG